MDDILTLASKVGTWDRVSTYCKVANRIFLYFQWVEYEREKYFWTAFHSICRRFKSDSLCRRFKSDSICRRFKSGLVHSDQACDISVLCWACLQWWQVWYSLSGWLHVDQAQCHQKQPQQTLVSLLVPGAGTQEEKQKGPRYTHAMAPLNVYHLVGSL